MRLYSMGGKAPSPLVGEAPGEGYFRINTIRIIKHLSRISIYLKFLRPFTLYPPAIGMISGGISAFGAYPKCEFSPRNRNQYRIRFPDGGALEWGIERPEPDLRSGD